jgi:hypothetical protein
MIGVGDESRDFGELDGVATEDLRTNVSKLDLSYVS